MRNFIIFFSEKEGTSPLVRLLDNFDQISIVHQVNNLGWEPFDRHNCGSMPLDKLKHCLNILFGSEPIDIEELNRIYTQNAVRPLERLCYNKGVLGFKMRFHPPKKTTLPPIVSTLPKISSIINRFDMLSFKPMMIDLLKKNNVVVFWAVRQDVLRWALSKYHGDGTGKNGHLQFKIAAGDIKKDEIGKIFIDCSRLEQIINICEKLHVQKRKLFEEFRSAGILTYPLIYEDFLHNKQGYFQSLLNKLEIDISKNEISRAINKGACYKKVHSNDISDFVINHEEVLNKFGDRFFSWRNLSHQLVTQKSSKVLN